MWDLPRPGTEPVSPALAGRILPTALSGESRSAFFHVLSYLEFTFSIKLNVVYVPLTGDSSF